MQHSRRGFLGLMGGAAAAASLPLQAFANALPDRDLKIWVSPQFKTALDGPERSYDPLINYKDDLKYFSNGFYNSQITTGLATAESCVSSIVKQKAEFPLYVLPTASLREVSPSMDLFDIPYFTPYTSSCYNLVTSDTFQKIFTGHAYIDESDTVQVSKPASETNVLFLGWMFFGPRMLCFKENYFPKDYMPETFKGMKAGVLGQSPVVAKSWEKVGIKPVDTTREEAPKLLLNGGLDMMANTLYGLTYLPGYKEAFRMVANQSSTYFCAALVCPLDWFKRLPQKQQYALVKASKQLTDMSATHYTSFKNHVLYDLANNFSSDLNLVSVSKETREAWCKALHYRTVEENLNPYWHDDLKRIIMSYKFNGFTLEERTRFLELSMAPRGVVVQDY